MTVCIIDTSVFCEILDVPFMASDRNEVMAELTRKIVAREQLVLPMTAILETGNHIGQNGNGAERRQVAERFVGEVGKAVNGTSPFRTTAFLDPDKLSRWLTEFPDWTKVSDPRGKGSGLGDLTIKKEWDDLCAKLPGHRVYIWSKDAQLASYDRDP